MKAGVHSVHLLLCMIAASFLSSRASAASPRRLRAHPAPQAPHAGRCGGHKNVQLISTGAKTADAGIFFDGFSRVTCEVDVAPASVRISFKEHACGEVPSCRLMEMPMEPRLCFDFCRTQEQAKFFGLVHGRDCYCTTYFQAKSTGGQGVCDAPCEGDNKEMCGGMEKSSLFEMHMCADSGEEAAMAQNQSAEALNAGVDAWKQADDVAAELNQLALDYKLEVCSIVPEGKRVCAVRQAWNALAADLGKASSDLGHAVEVLHRRKADLEGLQENEQPAENTTAAAASALEKTTALVGREAAKVAGATAMAKVVTSRVGGPLSPEELGALTGEERQTARNIFQKLAHVDGSWNGLCALTEIPGEAYAALAGEEDWEACAKRCLQLSTGLEACAAFNFQYWKGTGEVRGRLAACQLLKEEGLVEPSIAKAVPVFEVAKDTADSFGLAAMACYAKKGWMAGHPKGPLKAHIVRSVQTNIGS